MWRLADGDLPHAPSLCRQLAEVTIAPVCQREARPSSGLGIKIFSASR